MKSIDYKYILMCSHNKSIYGKDEMFLKFNFVIKFF